MKRTNTKQTVLITGASSGIGLELAKSFAKHGHDLILAARSTDKLKSVSEQLSATHKIKTTIVTVDLMKPHSARDLVKAIKAQGLQVDVLVNNAGVGSFGSFTDLDLDKELAMIQLNVTALTELTGLILPDMVARKSGKILNVASTAAFQPGPFMAVYYATKAFVLSFSEAVANEVKEYGVTVTALCPGATTSGFQRAAQMEDSGLVNGKVIMGPQEVAEIGYRALMQGKTVKIAGLKNWLLAQSPRFFPRDFMTHIVRNVQASRNSN